MSADNFHIVVIGASAGGVRALQQLMGDLPADLNAAVFVVLHTAPSMPSLLAEILQRRANLPVAEAEEGTSIRKGTVTVARPDYHLVLETNEVRITRGPRENRHRPAVDALFRSAAHTHGGRVIGVVLTGALDDGTAGLWAIRDRMGIAIVQDPAEAEFPSMPSSAIEYAGADHVLPVAGIGALIAQLTSSAPNPESKPVSKTLDTEVLIAKEANGLKAGVMDLGEVTPYTCPECHGVLVQLREGPVPRFRCHTGHAYSINNLLAEATETVEHALWNAIRAIEESAMLLSHIAKHVTEVRQDPEAAALYEDKAQETLRRADVVRQATMEHQTLSQDNVAQVKNRSR